MNIDILISRIYTGASNPKKGKKKIPKLNHDINY